MLVSGWLLVTVSVLRSVMSVTYRSPRVVAVSADAWAPMGLLLLLPTLPWAALRVSVLPEVTRVFRLPSSTR